MAQNGQLSKIVASVLCLFFLFNSCKKEGKETGTTTESAIDSAEKAPVLKAPEFNADSCFTFIEKQLGFGPRVPGTAAHAACAEWFEKKLEAYGGEVYVQEAPVEAADGKTYQLKNIIASFAPSQPRRLMISAHWDSRPRADQDAETPNLPVPAANDGASGAAMMLEIARKIQQKAPGVGVDLFFWDLEDNGVNSNTFSWALGSQYWSRNKYPANYQPLYGINLDMVGAKGAKFYQDGWSAQYATKESNKVWQIASQLGYNNYFFWGNVSDGIIDDHYFVITIAGIPVVEIVDKDPVSGGFFPHWHTTKDDLNAIDKATLKAVGQTVLEVIYRE